MKNTFYLPLFFHFIIIPICLCQNSLEITRPELVMVNNIVNIHYQIDNSSPKDIFKVWIEITDTAGNQLQAKSLSGDLGAQIAGGNKKLIRWDLEADNMSPAGGIYVQVFAERINTPETEAKTVSEKSLSRSAIILQSAIFPGWGLTRVNKGKPHWIKGVLGTGCIATAIVFNQMGVNSYDKYLKTTDLNETEEYFDKSVRQDHISQICAYAAIGIWTTDIIWTIVGSSKNKLNRNNFTSGISIGTNYESSIQTQTFALKFNF